ncbi:MAG: hypothetical protein Q7T80_18905 [Methanoregula sp.]|nr:hypothetical protein [Methanoregula sp.]
MQDQPFFSRGAIIAIIGIAIAIIILLVVGFTQTMPGQEAVIPPQTCAEKTLQYVNNNLVASGTSATLTSVSETRGIYEMKIGYQGQAMTLYTTRDCSSLFTNRIEMNAIAPGSGTGTAQPVAAPIKTDRPVVELYVMAFCPYGTQAESVMRPAVALLGSKADIRVRYITTITGTTVASVRSLHGSPEAQEDLRQICILKKNPDKFWAYIGQFNDACWRNVTATVGIDVGSIETCASGEEGLSLLKADETLSNTNRASASPTLIINGQEYRGTRTPDAYKQAICDRFVTPPEECSTTLPPVAGTVATGGCG